MADDTRGPREIAYDEQINPLMKQIIDICKANGIPMLADFALDGDMPCTTAFLREEDNPPQHLRRAYGFLRPDAPIDCAGLLMVMTDEEEEDSD